MTETHLHRLPNGDFIDYGRNWRALGKDGSGPARHYTGETAEVMGLLIRYSLTNTSLSSGR